MKKSELKKLSKSFMDFVIETEKEPSQAIREFWAATFGCNNESRENELLEYWKAN
jgi:hypothetical protein